MEKNQVKKEGIGGWLLVFIFVLIIGRPITVCLNTIVLSKQINSFGDQLLFLKPYLYYYIASQSILAIVGVSAGVLMFKKNRNAVRIAKIFLVSCMAVSFIDCFVLFFILTNNGFDTKLIGYLNMRKLTLGIVSAGAWYAYLACSKRVENTYTYVKS